MKSRFLYFFTLASFVAPLCGQEPKTPPPLPTGILLKRTPDYSTWSVTVKSTARSQASPATGEAKAGAEKTNQEKTPVMRQSKIVKTGATILEVNMDAQGKREEIWHVSGIRAMKLPGATTPIVCPDFGGGDIHSIDFASSDFAGLDWISANTYTGVAKFQGRDCIEFKGNVSPLEASVKRQEAGAIMEAEASGETAHDEMKVAATAYIDLETRLPLLVIFGEEQRIYQYGAPPTTPLSPPAEVAGPLKAYAERIKRLSAPAARAF